MNAAFLLLTDRFFKLSLVVVVCACLRGGFAQQACAGEPSSATTTAAPAALPRPLGEAELLALLTRTLQEEQVKDRGQLELRLTRPWTPIPVPAEPVSLKVLELPTAGVTPSFIVRFELRAADRPLGTWQAAVQARVWRDIWVARVALKRGEPFDLAQVVLERRDVLPLREALAELNPDQPALQMADSVPAGAPLLARTLTLRPVIRRGQTPEAVVSDGALRITMRVEAMEDGAPGQVVRVRNPVTRRELVGRVVDAHTVQVLL